METAPLNIGADMIKFTVLNESVANALARGFSDFEYAKEALSSMLEISRDGVEVAVAEYRGLLLLRIFDGEYLFPYPVEIDAECEKTDVLAQIAEYALKEEVGLTFTDVPLCCVEYLKSVFPLSAVEFSDSECATLRIGTGFFKPASDFEINAGSVQITRLKKEDVYTYARLNADQNVNKYWGFDYKNAVSEPDDDYFYNETLREEEAKIALTFAIRQKGKLIGDVQLFRFDFHRGAEIAVRLFKEYWGRGVARAVISEIKKLLKSQGLLKMHARVRLENTRSIGLFDSLMSAVYDENDVRFYKCDL